jgi:hypothetical protein
MSPSHDFFSALANQAMDLRASSNTVVTSRSSSNPNASEANIIGGIDV